MIADRKQAKRVLDGAYGDQLDGAMKSLGFTRREGSLNYRRNIVDGHQRWVSAYRLHPRYARDGIHLSVYAEIVFPEVLHIAKQMLPISSVELVDWSMRLHPTEIVPGRRRMLIIRDQQSANETAAWLAGLLEKNPGWLLRQMGTVEGFVELARNGTLAELMTLNANDWISVAASQLSLGDRAGAHDILQQRGTDDPATYARAFEYLRGLSLD